MLINVKAVKEHCRKKGRRVGKDFLFAVNAYLQIRLDKACDIKDGGRKTLNRAVAEYTGFKLE